MYVVLCNVRKKDGKPLACVTDGATAFLYPSTRIIFTETLDQLAGAVAAGNGAAPGTTILTFFREDDQRA